MYIASQHRWLWIVLQWLSGQNNSSPRRYGGIGFLRKDLSELLSVVPDTAGIVDCALHGRGNGQLIMIVGPPQRFATNPAEPAIGGAARAPRPNDPRCRGKASRSTLPGAGHKSRNRAQWFIFH